MLIVRFLEKEYLFTGESLEEGGAITTKENYSNGTVSFAHLGADGIVRQLKNTIGTVRDIEVLRPIEEPEHSVRGWLNMINPDRSWTPPEAN